MVRVPLHQVSKLLILVLIFLMEQPWHLDIQAMKEKFVLIPFHSSDAFMMIKYVVELKLFTCSSYI